MAVETTSLEGDGPPMAGAAAIANRSRRMGGSKSAPALPGARPPLPPGSEMCSSPEASPQSGRLVPALRDGYGSAKGTPAESPPDSARSTPRTPRSVEVSVEGQEVGLPAGIWASADGFLEAQATEAKCTVTVKTGIAGKGGMHVVLRVGLKAHTALLRFEPTRAGLKSCLTTRVAGVESCDIGRLPCRSGSTPPVPAPGFSQHSWQEDQGSTDAAEQLSVEEALALGPTACAAEFTCQLTLRVNATCAVWDGGRAALRVEVDGELGLVPRFRPVGREAVTRLYAAARQHFCAGEDVKALQKCEESLLMGDGLTPRPRELGDALNLMGAVHLRRDAPTLAVKCLERALVLRRQDSSVDNGTIAATLNTLGNAHQTLHAHAEALRCHLGAVEILTKSAREDSSQLASALHSLGGTHRALGQLADARSCYERALGIREQALGKDHPLVATTLNNLGAVLQTEMQYRQAIGCYQRALAIEARIYGDDHPTAAATLSNLGAAHERVGDHQCAVDCHTRALSVQERSLGTEHPSVAATLHNLGNALASAGRGHDAARCHWRALSIWSKALGPAHPDIGATLHSLGNVYRGLQEPEAAAKCFAGALRIREVSLGPTHPETARTRHCAALVGCALGDCPAALQELQTAVNSLLSSLGSQHPWSLQARADVESLQRVVKGQ